MSLGVSTGGNWIRWFSGGSEKAVLRRPAEAATAVTYEVAVRTVQETSAEAFQAYVDSVRAIPSVEQVRANIAGTYIHLIVYVSESSEEDRFAVYDAEQAIFDRYPNLQFEFDLIDRRGYPMSDKPVAERYHEVIRQRRDLEYDLDAIPE